MFGKVLCDAASADKNIVAITAAMADGTGLKRFAHRFPDRFFDVGIAEGHGVTFAAGLAAGGLKPVFAVYSSFLQRGYDQLIHDVALQMAPKHKWEMADMLRFALSYDGPVALRYPRGTAYDEYQEYRAPVAFGKSEMIVKESKIALLSVGHMFEEAVKIRRMLKEKGYPCTLVNARFVKPLDEEMIRNLAGDHEWIVTLEENVQTGGFGERVQTFACQENLPVRVLISALPDEYVEHGSIDILRKETKIDAESVTEKIIQTVCQE